MLVLKYFPLFHSWITRSCLLLLYQLVWNPPKQYVGDGSLPFATQLSVEIPVFCFKSKCISICVWVKIVSPQNDGYYNMILVKPGPKSDLLGPPSKGWDDRSHIHISRNNYGFHIRCASKSIHWWCPSDHSQRNPINNPSILGFKHLFTKY